MIPMHEKFPEIEQDPVLHAAISEELKHCEEFDEEHEIQGKHLLNRLM